MQSTQFGKTVRIGEYCFQDSASLGTGSFGHVYKGSLMNLSSQNEPVAIKQLHLRDSTMLSLPEVVNRLNQEIELIQDLHHPHIANYIDAVRSDKHAYIIMEYCNGGNLEDFVIKARPDQPTCLRLFAQLIDAIRYLFNEKRILHRDIKPQNILLHNSQVKVCDFGVSRKLDTKQTTLYRTVVGSPLFSSPQILGGIQLQLNMNKLFQRLLTILGQPYTTKTDVWSLGITLYFMLFYGPCEEGAKLKNEKNIHDHSYPWNGINASQLLKAIKKKPEVVFPENYNVSEDVKDLLRRMLQIKEADRISLQELLDHRLFANEGDTMSMQNSLSLNEQDTTQKKEEVHDMENNSTIDDTIYHETVQKQLLLSQFIVEIIQRLNSNDIREYTSNYFMGKQEQMTSQLCRILINNQIAKLQAIKNEGNLDPFRKSYEQIDATINQLSSHLLTSQKTDQLSYEDEQQKEILLIVIQHLFLGMRTINTNLANQNDFSIICMKYIFLLDDLLVLFFLEHDILIERSSNSLPKLLISSPLKQMASPFALFSRIVSGYHHIFKPILS